jgi:hypothetical protein
MAKNRKDVKITDLPPKIQEAIKNLNTGLKKKGAGKIVDDHIVKELLQEGDLIIKELGPDAIVRPDNGPGGQEASGVNPKALAAVKKLIEDCKGFFYKEKTNAFKGDIGVQGIVSSYRGYTYQTTNFLNKIASGRSLENTQAATTVPGFSQHHTGKAFDIFSTEASWWDARPEVKKWIADNCGKYGLRVTYSKKGVLRIEEPWHVYYFLEDYKAGTKDETNQEGKSETETPNPDPLTGAKVESKPKTEAKDVVIVQSDEADVKTINKTSVNGKVILKVKSGPGVIIGDTERDIQNGEVSFKGIEFDQPGDYVVSVTSTSPNVNPFEFKVTVLSELIVIEQEPSKDKDDQKPPDGPRPIIAQINQPKVDLPPMKFEASDNKSDNEQVAGQIGLTPFFNYMGSTIRDKDISSLKLYHDGIIPVIKIIFIDTNHIIKSVGFPQDDTKFEFFLNSRSQNIKSIHLKFKIEEFTSMNNGKYSIYGTLDISELYRIKYQTYNGTSFEALKQISSELKLGFNSNIINTDDKMSWRNVGDKQHNFVESVIKHSYSSEKSYMCGFIDYYYCFNFVDVEKEWNRDNSKDMCIYSSGLDDGRADDTEKLSRLILTTDKGDQQSNCLIEEKSFENNSTSLALTKGYMTRTKYYDKVNKMFLIFNVDSTTSDQSKSMILKGSEGDRESFNNNITTTYSGKIDTDNVHKNYNYSITQNKINFDNLNKIRMVVNLPNPNYNIYLYQKVTVTVINKEPPTETNKEIVQWRKSGDYIISAINYVWNGLSLKQEVELISKELGKNPEEIEKGPPPSAVKEVKDPKQENPLVPTTVVDDVVKDAVPNSKYTVGDVYTVENSNGVRLLLTITNVLANGNEVTATIKQILPSTDIPNPNLIRASTGLDY